MERTQQKGLVKKFSTQHNILQIMDGSKKINEIQSKKHQYFAISIDCSKAFDSTNHSILREVLFLNLFDNSKYNWALNDFLLSNYSSGISLDEPIKINQVNPQCSKIFPKLFTIYLNETLRKIRRTLDYNLEMISAYAEDIVIIVKHRDNLKRLIK
jgi:hypothetical protein